MFGFIIAAPPPPPFFSIYYVIHQYDLQYDHLRQSKYRTNANEISKKTEPCVPAGYSKFSVHILIYV